MKFRLFLPTVLLLPTFATASPEVFFTSQDNVQNQLVAAIDACHTSLHAALYSLSSPALLGAVRHAAERGVAVQLVLDASHKLPPLPSGFPNLQIRTLAGKPTDGKGLMHNKFAVFDSARMVTGSFNWTSDAQGINYENVLFEDDLHVVQNYEHQFDDLWHQAALAPATSQENWRTSAQTVAFTGWGSSPDQWTDFHRTVRYSTRLHSRFHHHRRHWIHE